MHYLYRILFPNGKNYIGQSIDPAARWRNHKYHSKKDISQLIVHDAIRKYGFKNCFFEIIATCKNQDDANEIETLLVEQYQSHISTCKGYNVSAGGSNAPKTEKWKQSLRDWHASLSEEEKLERSQKLSKSFTKYIQEQGHPAQGTKRTPEQSQNLSRARLEHPVNYTPELRQRMSDSHKGQKPSPETVEKRKVSLKATTDAKTAAKIESGEYKCNASDCEIQGKHKYKIINNIRYCAKHAERLIRLGSLDLPEIRTAHNKGKSISEETRLKLIGRKPHNRHEFTKEQIDSILNDPRGAKRVAVDFSVTEKVIIRVRRENKPR